MVANTAAAALSNFLTSAPEAPSPDNGQLMDRLGQMLLPAGDAGRPIAEAMAESKLSRPDFLGLLASATSGGLVETFDDHGVQSVRLTPVGRSVY